MAVISSSTRSISSSSLSYQSTIQRQVGTSIKASCYAVDASSLALKGFHYSTTRVGGMFEFKTFKNNHHTDYSRGRVVFLRSARYDIVASAVLCS